MSAPSDENFGLHRCKRGHYYDPVQGFCEQCRKFELENPPRPPRRFMEIPAVITKMQQPSPSPKVEPEPEQLQSIPDTDKTEANALELEFDTLCLNPGVPEQSITIKPHTTSTFVPTQNTAMNPSEQNIDNTSKPKPKAYFGSRSRQGETRRRRNPGNHTRRPRFSTTNSEVPRPNQDQTTLVPRRFLDLQGFKNHRSIDLLYLGRGRNPPPRDQPPRPNPNPKPTGPGPLIIDHTPPGPDAFVWTGH